MPKQKTSTANCIKAINAVIEDLQRQGAIDTVLVAALAEAAVQTAQAEKESAQMHLDALAAITKAAADAKRAGTAMNMAQALFSTP